MSASRNQRHEHGSSTKMWIHTFVGFREEVEDRNLGGQGAGESVGDVVIDSVM